MSSYLIDTQTLLLAFLSPAHLPKKVRTIMQARNSDRILSAVSIVEIGIKNTLNKINITEAELQMAIRDLELRVIPFAPEHAFGLFRLPQRTDIFDKMLVATALSLNIPIIGGDRNLELTASANPVTAPSPNPHNNLAVSQNSPLL